MKKDTPRFCLAGYRADIAKKQENIMKHAGINMGLVKKQNRASILNYICETGPVSRKDIADVTGLTPAAVTQICTDFMTNSLLVETGQETESHGAGRKKVLVDINYEYAYIFAVNMEPEETTVALANMRGVLKEKVTLATRRDIAPEEFLKEIADLCRKIQEKHPGWSRKIAGVSVGITGIVNKERGSSVRAYGIWNEEVMVCEILSELLGCPVIIENNVNAFATAELMYGLGKQYDNLLVIKWGPGVGSTIVINNEVYEGRRGKAAELGHFIVERNGQLCSCGRRGCLETKVSYQALSKQHPFVQEEFEKEYLEALEKNEADRYEEAIDLFARTIVNSVTILAPNRVVLSGKMFRGRQIRKRLIECCISYDESCNEKRIIYTPLADEEDYIGPVACFVQTQIF